MIRLILEHHANYGHGEYGGLSTYDLHDEELEKRLTSGASFDGTFSYTDIIGAEVIHEPITTEKP